MTLSESSWGRGGVSIEFYNMIVEFHLRMRRVSTLKKRYPAMVPLGCAMRWERLNWLYNSSQKVSLMPVLTLCSSSRCNSTPLIIIITHNQSVILLITHLYLSHTDGISQRPTPGLFANGFTKSDLSPQPMYGPLRRRTSKSLSRTYVQDSYPGRSALSKRGDLVNLELPLTLKSAILTFSCLGLRVSMREMDLSGGRMISFSSRTARVDMEQISLLLARSSCRFRMRSSIWLRFSCDFISSTSSLGSTEASTSLGGREGAFFSSCSLQTMSRVSSPQQFLFSSLSFTFLEVQRPMSKSSLRLTSAKKQGIFSWLELKRSMVIFMVSYQVRLKLKVSMMISSFPGRYSTDDYCICLPSFISIIMFLFSIMDSLNSYSLPRMELTTITPLDCFTMLFFLSKDFDSLSGLSPFFCYQRYCSSSLLLKITSAWNSIVPISRFWNLTRVDSDIFLAILASFLKLRSMWPEIFSLPSSISIFSFLLLDRLVFFSVVMDSLKEVSVWYSLSSTVYSSWSFTKSCISMSISFLRQSLTGQLYTKEPFSPCQKGSASLCSRPSMMKRRQNLGVFLRCLTKLTLKLVILSRQQQSICFSTVQATSVLMTSYSMKILPMAYSFLSRMSILQGRLP